MHLLKTGQCELIETKDIPDPFPQYAILSHTWISPNDEITYQDLKQRNGDMKNDISKQKGWAKEWAWMDNCCIDKTNLAETQEAICSTFRWYQNAGICYAYLEDVDVNKILNHPRLANGIFPIDRDLDDIAGEDNVANAASFSHMALKVFLVKAKWFTRGWTLQELLAPPYLVFVDRAWRRIGTRESWAKEIKDASRIDARHLTCFNPADLTSCSIAMRLSWASYRETTVEEDETYSLLGLFGISLPLIYGEGRLRAFNRLQRELISVYNDDSIFAWKAPRQNKHFPGAHWTGYKPAEGILAPSIREFWDAFSVRSFGYYGNRFSMTNRGLQTNAKRWRRKNDHKKCMLRLNCGVESAKHLGIALSHVAGSYERTQVEKLLDMKTIDLRDWEEDRGSESTFIRASNDLSVLPPSSIFALEYPDQISIGKKYFVDYGIGMVRTNMQHLAESFPVYDLRKDELVIEPNQIVFINIVVQYTASKSELDLIINLTDNGFPSVGILARGEKPWERLGDPIIQALHQYEGLAEHLHHKVPPVYPVIALEETDNAIGICLLPRPSLGRSLQLPPEKANSVPPREYMLKVTVEEDSGPDSPESSSRKRKRGT
ncbi:heterokaryon incompatibility protein-domain-containing protein [Hypoxylon argillaceum]|nr:heterokaryon incompatibility protein-domain-containing protein [Hypoxylon argillaceum]